MGIQDRDYYRNEGPSVLDSLMPSGLVCRWLIAINVGCWFLQMTTMIGAASLGLNDTTGSFTDWFILDVNDVKHGQVWRLLTFAFLHSPETLPLHLFFNMLFLWWFGSDIEQLYGRKEFLAIYLTSALLGGLAYFGWGLTLAHNSRCLGASGVVSTMLILCALHYPRRMVSVFFLVPMPIWLFAILNVAQDVLIFGGRQNTRVAAVVHLAGAVFAVGYFKWQGSITESLSGLMFWKSMRARPRLKLFTPDNDKEEPVAVSANSAPATAVDEHLEAKLDAVLEKIAKSGKDSLTPQEEQILKQASEMYKRKRH
jgi:membrane associated rhomboid family serine protease